MTEPNSDKILITVRLIRSFEHKNWKPLVVKNIRPDYSLEDLFNTVREAIVGSSVPPPFKTFHYDTFKIEYQAHGWKTNDPLINTENDEKLILKPDGGTLAEQGVRNETEISFFKMEDYINYKSKSS